MNNNTRQTVNKYNFKFQKSLGQNFLIDDKVVEDIIKGSNISKNDHVVEIGPGVGTLTKELLKVCKKVTAIEIDDSLIPILKEELKDFENFNLIHDDVLNIDLKELFSKEKVKVVANLPYYVTTPILLKLLEEDFNYSSITVMIQKEVALRLNASPSTKDYGALTLLVNYHTDSEIIRVVKPESFIPRPKVDSAVIRLDKRDVKRINSSDEKFLFKVIRQSFAMRRKTLFNTLKPLGLGNDVLLKVLEDSNIDAKRRGETLTLEEFNILSENLKSKMGGQ